jgi:signal transduction histidine kinase
MLNTKSIYFIVALIGCLLLASLLLSNYNNAIIKENKQIQVKTESIKRYYDQIGKEVIHSLDIGLRGFALIREPSFVKPMNNSILKKDSIISQVEIPLKELNYDLSEFQIFKDSLNAYIEYGIALRQLLIENREEEFLTFFRTDKGAKLWAQYISCEESIRKFLDKIDDEAQNKYERALASNNLIQILLLVLTIPTLGFLAFHTSRTYSLSQLVLTHTHELENANKELIEQKDQLEQYSYIVAHNLRAPLTQILGLVKLIQLSTSQTDKDEAMTRLVVSANDLGYVIKDLNTILEIKRQTKNLTEINLEETLQRTRAMLEEDIRNSQVEIQSELHVTTIVSVAPYIESIFYNLISNSIKYRDAERKLIITIKSSMKDNLVCLSFSDNGLGIDLERFKDSIFGLYKRFHLHVEGKGLGLYLVRTQVETMGGKIEIESSPGQGTTFLIYLKSISTGEVKLF